MNTNEPELTQFFGNFHPLILHLPIGFLCLLGILEALAVLPRFRQVAAGNRVILILSVPATAVTALTGWWLGAGEGYDPELLGWHRWLGVAVVALVPLLLLAQVRSWIPAYRLGLLVTLVLVGAAGHFGGSLTHGQDFLARHAPVRLRPFLGGHRTPAKPHSATPAAGQKPADAPVFESHIQPILDRTCVSCHGPEKAKGHLRLDSLAAALKGGENGPTIVAGKATGSSLVERIRLPLSHDDHMPPEGKPQPTPEQVALLAWWIDAGAVPGKSARELGAPEAIIGALQ